MLVDVSELSIEDSKSGTQILNGLEFTCQKGKVSAIIGESGSGKSTFAMSLFGLNPPELKINYKRYTLLGKDFSSITEKDFLKIRGKDIVFIPQSPYLAFHPYMKIGKQMKEMLSLKAPDKLNKDTIVSYLKKVGLENPESKLEQFPAQLSGGERQRVLIAIAAILKPQIIVADEPSTALDSINQKNILRLLYSIILEEQISLILITHDMKIVSGMADDVIVLKKGCFVEKAIIKDKVPMFKSDYSLNLWNRTHYPLQQEVFK